MKYCTCVEPTVRQFNDATKCDICEKEIDFSEFELSREKSLDYLIADTSGGGIRSESPAIPAKKALPQTPRDVKEIVKQYLIINGYGGLCTEDCGCEVDDLRPCCEDFSDCEPGYLHENGEIWTTKQGNTEKG